MTQENMIKSIYKCAKTYHQRGVIVNIRTGEYSKREEPVLSEQEIRHIKNLKANVHYAN